MHNNLLCQYYKFNKIHDVILFLLAIVYLLIILQLDKISSYNFILLLLLCNLAITIIFVVKNKLQYLKILLLFMLSLLPVAISIFFMVLLFNKNIQNEYLFSILLIYRIYLITISSLVFIFCVDFEELIYYCMQQLKLPLNIAYALLIAVHAINYFKKELWRIKIAHLMRFHNNKFTLKILKTLLVSAAVYANNHAISLSGRGIVKNKTFLRTHNVITIGNIIFIIINILLLLFVWYYDKFI